MWLVICVAMQLQKLEEDEKVGRTKDCALELAQQVLDSVSVAGCPTMWHIRARWHMWGGSHYRPVPPEAIEQAVLSHLKQQATHPISASAIRSTVELLKMMQHREVDRVPFWLQPSPLDPGNILLARNGILQLGRRAPKLLAHSPWLFATSAVEYDYDPKATCPRWCQFLGELWRDDNSQEALRRWFAYCLLHDTSQQKILVITGPPRSGKSTVARVLTALLGRDAVASPSIRDLSGQFGLWGLLDKKLATVPDAVLPRPCPAVEELLKSVSGEDAVDIHRKGMPPLTGVRLPTRLMLLANEYPAFKDPSGALDRRIIRLQTNRSFSGAEDTALTAKLLDELPGILNWAIGRIGEFPLQPPKQGVSVSAKLRKGKHDMTGRCEVAAAAILKEAGVRRVRYHSNLRGAVDLSRRAIEVPKPTTRRRLYVLAREAGRMSLKARQSTPSYLLDFEAAQYAHKALRRHRIAVPKKSTEADKLRVVRGILRAVRQGVHAIDRKAFRWCQAQLPLHGSKALSKIRLTCSTDRFT